MKKQNHDRYMARKPLAFSKDSMTKKKLTENLKSLQERKNSKDIFEGLSTSNSVINIVPEEFEKGHNEN